MTESGECDGACTPRKSPSARRPWQLSWHRCWSCRPLARRNISSPNAAATRPTGDDGKAATSLALAWRTLSHAARSAKAGQTVYVGEGVYEESLSPADSGAAGKPIKFLRRGRDKVVLDGGGRQVGGPRDLLSLKLLRTYPRTCVC